MFIYWFLIALTFLLLELGHPGLLFFVSFSCGAFAAAITSLFVEVFVWQVVVFLVATVVSLAALKYWVVHCGIRSPKHGTSNIYALEGKKGIVIKQITPNQMGQVKLNGEIWSARCAHEEIVDVGTEIIVLAVKGAHIVVERKKS